MDLHRVLQECLDLLVVEPGVSALEETGHVVLGVELHELDSQFPLHAPAPEDLTVV